MAKILLVRLKIRYHGWQLAIKKKTKNKPTGVSHKFNLLVMQESYIVPFILPHLIAAGAYIHYFSMEKTCRQSRKIADEKIRTSLLKVWQEIIREPRFWSLLEDWEQGQTIVEPWLKHLWFQYFFEHWQGVLQGRKYLTNRKVHGIIVANTGSLHPLGVGVGFLHAARLTKIPVFSALHGTLSGYCLHPITALLELPFSDFCFSNGLGVAKYLQQVAERYPIHYGVALAPGSPMFDAMRQGLSQDKILALRQKLAGTEKRPLVLHIPGFLDYHRRLSGDALACLPYFKLQKQVIELFAETRKVRLVYRSFPSEWPDLMPKVVRQLVPEAIVAGKEIKLADLVWAVDAIILDYPATPLSESLLTDKPLVVYSDNRYYKMFDKAKASLRKRAILAETPEAYLSAIKDFLRQSEFEAIPLPDNGFRRYYITDQDDGKAAERVADYIVNVLGFQN